MTRYLYQIVSGASVWGSPRTIALATEGTQRNQAKRLGFGDFEVERILDLPGNARRYWRWRRGRWRTETHTHADETTFERWHGVATDG